MNFKDSYVPATKRKSIQHLYDEKNPMKPLDFLSFCSDLKENGFVLSNFNSKLTEKIDGFGFRFGIDSFLISLLNLLTPDQSFHLEHLGNIQLRNMEVLMRFRSV